MRNLNDFYDLDGKTIDVLRKATILNIKNLLSHNKKVTPEMIEAVGIIEDGRLQIKVPTDISKIGIVKLIGYLMWFWDISPEEIGWPNNN